MRTCSLPLNCELKNCYSLGSYWKIICNCWILVVWYLTKCCCVKLGLYAKRYSIAPTWATPTETSGAQSFYWLEGSSEEWTTRYDAMGCDIFSTSRGKWCDGHMGLVFRLHSYSQSPTLAISSMSYPCFITVMAIPGPTTVDTICNISTPSMDSFP